MAGELVKVSSITELSVGQESPLRRNSIGRFLVNLDSVYDLPFDHRTRSELDDALFFVAPEEQFVIHTIRLVQMGTLPNASPIELGVAFELGVRDKDDAYLNPLQYNGKIAVGPDELNLRLSMAHYF